MPLHEIEPKDNKYFEVYLISTHGYWWAKISATRQAERMRCAECEMTTHSGPMVRHQNASGHISKVSI
jgi:hypothetical protein